MNDKTAKPEDNIEVQNLDNNDGGGNDRGLAAPPSGGEPSPPQPELPADGANPEDARAAIAARFKKVRVDKEPGIEATGDHSDPAQVYGKLAEPGEPAPAEPSNEPPKRKLKVNMKEVEVSEEDMVAAAQKALAADDYLDQAKRKAKQLTDEAQQILETTRVHVSRQNPADRPAPTATEGDDHDDPQNPADPLKEVIEQIQYGDPDKAKDLLGKTIADAAQAAVKQVSTTDRVQQDIAADLLAHDEFVKKHADIADDEDAHDFIRSGLLRGYRDDLRKIGVPEESIPTDATQLANHHRRYKLQGQPVRSVATLLDAAHDRLTTFRGGTPRTENKSSPSAEPRVEVNLNRDDRRRNIPQQPPRANVQPSQQMQSPQSQTDSRKTAVQRAQAARGQ